MLVNVGRSYYEELLKFGVKIYEYEAGINHSKVALIDDDWLMVGSANFDVRSMRLNFERNALVRDRVRASELHCVLTNDFACSSRIALDEFVRRSRIQRFKESLVRPLVLFFERHLVFFSGRKCTDHSPSRCSIPGTHSRFLDLFAPSSLTRQSARERRVNAKWLMTE